VKGSCTVNVLWTFTKMSCVCVCICYTVFNKIVCTSTAYFPMPGIYKDADLHFK
jgi:hypothetical protein